MSETWEHTRGSVRRLKAALQAADEDTRYRFVFWMIGMALMASAIVLEFGWTGALFCAGVFVWAAGDSKPH